MTATIKLVSCHVAGSTSRGACCRGSMIRTTPVCTDLSRGIYTLVVKFNRPACPLLAIGVVSLPPQEVGTPSQAARVCFKTAVASCPSIGRYYRSRRA